jgi:hypothetical protein
MAALVGNLVVAVFGFSGVALTVLLAVMVIAFVFKLITNK